MLHSFCRYPGDDSITRIQRCLDEGADINRFDDDDETPLGCAVRGESLDLVRYLIEKGANPNLSGPNAFPPLVIAAALGLKDIVDFLLIQPDIDVNIYQLNQGTALFTAAQEGHLDIVKQLISAGARPINALITSKDEATSAITIDRTTPLIIAVNNEHTEVSRLLLQHFPGLVNQPCEQTGIVPLHRAAQLGNIDLVNLLLEFHAEVDVCFNCFNKKHTPLLLAARSQHNEIVKIFLTYPHRSINIRNALHAVTSKMLECRNAAERHTFYQCSELLRVALSKQETNKALTLDDSPNFTWHTSFRRLFSFGPSLQDMKPDNDESTLRFVLSSIYQLLTDPESCIVYLQFLSRELECQWKNEHQGESFPKFDKNKIELWVNEGLTWPIPVGEIEPLKKSALLDRILLAKFKQYGMGDQCGKWTGYVPKSKAKSLLSHNAFFTENRRTANGFFHGNVHNIQRVLILYAMESGKIPLTYTDETGKTHTLEPKDVFSALMRNDLLPDKKMEPLWQNLLDGHPGYPMSFTYPHCLHSMLLTNPAFEGVLQDYLLFSFCSHFIKMRELHNHVYGTTYTNTTLCHEVGKVMQHLFIGLPEPAIQYDEKRDLSLVSRIDELPEKSRMWSITEKHYKPLPEPTARYTC